MHSIFNYYNLPCFFFLFFFKCPFKICWLCSWQWKLQFKFKTEQKIKIIKTKTKIQYRSPPILLQHSSLFSKEHNSQKIYWAHPKKETSAGYTLQWSFTLIIPYFWYLWLKKKSYHYDLQYCKLLKLNKYHSKESKFTSSAIILWF